MKVAIVTEAGKNTGFGHLTRCSAIYDAFRSKGINPTLIVNTDMSIKDSLSDRKHRIIDWIKHEGIFSKLIQGIDVVVVDSYLAGPNSYKIISESCRVKLYVDDNNRLNYPAGVVLNGSIYAEEINYKNKNDVYYLLGVKYMPLRRVFWSVPRKKIRKTIKNVLVTFGGCDVKNLTLKILKFLVRFYPNLNKIVIIGKGFVYKEQIKVLDDNHIESIYSPDMIQIKDLMLDADIAISGGGQTLYELARIGVPTIAIGMTENQRYNLIGWRKAGFINRINWYDDFGLLDFIRKDMDLFYSVKERTARCSIGRACIDGMGVFRILKKISGLLK